MYICMSLSGRDRERVFGWNGYSRQQFNRATRPRNIELRRQQTGDVGEKVGWTCLPYIHKVTDRIGRMLEKHKVKTIFKPTRTIQQSLRSAKDKILYRLLEFTGSRAAVDPCILERLNVVSKQE